MKNHLEQGLLGIILHTVHFTVVPPQPVEAGGELQQWEKAIVVLAAELEEDEVHQHLSLHQTHPRALRKVH